MLVNVAALIPRITALSSRASPILASAATRLRAMGVQVGSKADDLVAWAKANPGNATMLAMSLGSVGVMISDLFDTPEGKSLAAKIETSSIGLADVQKVLDAGASSEKLNLQVTEVAADAFTAIEILRWAKGQYGSSTSAIRAHKLHQAFFEMPLDDVEVGYQTLRV